MGSPARILLVEDEELTLRATADLLSDDGYEVAEASGCDEALAQLETAAGFDVLVTDINLTCPGDGMSLAKIAAERWPDMRIVIVSGEARPLAGEYPERAVFFTKPYAPGALLTVVNSPDFA